MFQITEQQIENRWNVLPIRLLEVLCSFDTGKMILEICKKNHIIGEKSDKISGLTGFVIMGFLHPEDLVQEIKEATGIHSEIAKTIVKELDRKIFAPIRGEIDKVYASPGALAEEKSAEENAFAANEAKLPSTEISKEHIVDLRTIETKKEEIKTAEPPKIIKLEESFDAAQDKPFIIHKEEGAKPILGAKRSLGGLFGFLKGGKEAELKKAVEAKIEIGGMKTEEVRREPEQKLETETPKMKVVHYSEFRTPIDSQKPAEIQKPAESQKLDIPEIEPPASPQESLLAAEAAKVFMDMPAPPKSPTPPSPPASAPMPAPTSASIPPLPPQKPKFETKEGEEVIDLRTMKRIEK